MAGEWQEVPLAQVARISSGRRPSRILKEAAPDCQVPVIGGGPSGYTDSALFDGGILITERVGTLGKLFAPSGPCWPSDNALVIQPSSCETDVRFLRYALQHVIAEAAWMNRGAANPLITQGDLGRLAIGHPPLSEQRAIAHILGTLDDKIELNRRMSETLEQMARALFKAWFVDFEPVRAKCRGDLDSRPRWRRGQSLPGLPAHLYDLFPNRLVDSELGEIPEGWEVGTVSALADVSSGKRPEIRFPAPSEKATVPLWGGNGPMGFVPEPLYDEPILLTGRVGTLGSVFRVTKPCWPSDNTLVIRANHESTYEYLFLQLQLIDFVSLNRGSTQPLLTQSDLKARLLLLPGPNVLKCFSRVVSALYERIDEWADESRTLAALRDALLPKLISGELRVKDAERFLKERGL